MTVNYEALQNDFVVESRQLLERAEAAILGLEADPSAQHIDSVFRSIHTVKGNAGIFDLTDVIRFAHALETYLNRFRSGEIRISHEEIDTLLIAVDELRALLAKKDHSIPEGLLERLGGKTEAALAGHSTVSGSAAVSIGSVASGSTAKVSSGNSDSTLRIPAKFLRDARERGMTLSIVYLDAAAQNESLADFCLRIETLRNSNSLLQTGIRSSRLSTMNGLNGSRHLPYFAVLATAGAPGAELERAGLTADQVRILYSPDAPAANAPTSGTSSMNPAQARPALMGSDPLSPAGTTATSRHPAETKSHSSSDTHLRVPVKLIDMLMNVAGETVIARNELLQKSELIREASVLGVTRKLGHLITRLQEGIMRTRLQELNYVFQRIPRIIRDTAQATGKVVEFALDGGDVELDKSMIDSIGESLLHIIRNAVDHGIEKPAERKLAGKPEAGFIRVTAVLRGGNVVLSVQDDGQGLDMDRIRNKAVERGIMTRERADTASNAELSDLIFLPGFSTAERITSTSGRGVGMDIVREHFKRAGGSVEMESVAGKGSTITAVIPQTLTITTCLLVLCGGERYALPQQSIVELALLDRELVQVVEDHRLYNLRGRLIPLISATSMLYSEEKAGTEVYVAVVKTEKHLFSLALDDILNPEEIVIRPLGAHLSGISIFSGAAIMGDGEAVLILDAAGIARVSALDTNVREDAHQRSAISRDQNQFLLFHCSGRAFAASIESKPRIVLVQSSTLENIAGREVVQVRGEVIPVVRLEGIFQIPNIEREWIHLIIFEVDGKAAAITAHDVHSVETLSKVEYSNRHAGAVGHTIWNEQTTLVIRPHDLLKSNLGGR